MTPRRHQHWGGSFAAASAVLYVLVSCVLVSARAVAQDGTRSADGRLHLGVLRADGILLPFASFDGDDWRASWPSDLNRDLPVSVDAVPRGWWGGAAPAHPWRVWPAAADKPIAFELVAPAMVQVGAGRRLGIRTSFAAQPVTTPPFIVSFPKIGLASSGAAQVQAIPSVSRAAPARRELLAEILADITAAEERTVSGLRSDAGWRHPFDRAARAAIQPELEAWYTSAVDEPGRRASYVEVVKKYPPGPEDEGCGLETFVSGWIDHAAAPNARPRTSLKAVVTYCDRQRASFMLPLGYVTLRNRVHWIYQMAGQDHEWYVVAEISRGRARVVSEYYAGGLLP